MFTGIITDIGTIREARATADTRVVIGCGFDVEGVAIGASIACSGVCLTVVEKGSDWFAADVSRESIARSAAGMWNAGRRLNLERALRVGDELGGHIVTGHVDGVGVVHDVCEEGGSHRVVVAVPASLAPFIASKGSVTIDGVSLTVNDVRDTDSGAEFSVNIIPHSWCVTTLGGATKGLQVNLEIDVLARYLARMKDVLSH